MTTIANETEFERTIQRALTGTTIEATPTNTLAEPAAAYGQNQGFVLGYPQDFDANLALDKRLFWQFLESTQAETLNKIKSRYNDWQSKIEYQFDKLISKYGILYILKKGLSIDELHFTLLYPTPLASSDTKVHEQFAQNIFSCMRQVQYSCTNPREEIDMVLFINGIPLITLELKYLKTGQTAAFHGQKQYRENRDANQPLLKFARCLVHMAVDSDEAYMTTKLAGKNTLFLPFNKGDQQGKGNPPNPKGYKTAYLWEEIFSKDSLVNIIQHFVRLDGKSSDNLAHRTLYFPRYHQLDVVRRLIEDCSRRGVGKTYLIQHSAGSGKSNSITWLAYQLIETYPANTQAAGNKTIDMPLFDSVIVVTDRRILDKQINDNIKAFSEVKNIITHANTSGDLRTALETGKKIIISTIQKFPFIVEGISDLSDKRFAVIIDEAHSSQSGTAHDNMNRAMGVEEESEEDIQDKILQAMQARKMRHNASYFAFTATPKNTTLERFGEKQANGSFKPFHLYSMKQAIEEGFILDVLANYTTYKSYYEISKSIKDNPLFNRKKAQKKLRAYVERNQQTIDIKAEIMLEHFMDSVVNRKKLQGKAKGMIVTQNIEAAIRYYHAIHKLLGEKGTPFKVLIAFSGEKIVDGISYSETQINGFAEDKTKEYFESDEYRLLVVANKYLTGFDQPKLTAMYVDKKLAGVLCVQTLSRLNRSAPKLGKKTEDLFVLDFFNTTDDIKQAFEPFYTATSLEKATDVQVLNELKEQLDEVGVYEWQEVTEFNTRFFNNQNAESLNPLIDIAATRFNKDLSLSEEEKVNFKVKAKQFVKIYGQMAAILSFENIVWEQLFWFLKFLIPKLNVKNTENESLDELLESVDLNTYGLQRTKLNVQIELDDEEGSLAPQNPNPRNGHDDGDKDPLDEIIAAFNQRWFEGWSATPEEQRIKFESIVNSVRQHPDYKNIYQKTDDPHHKALMFEKILESIMLKRRKEEMELYKLYAGDPAFKATWIQSIERLVSGKIL